MSQPAIQTALPKLLAKSQRDEGIVHVLYTQQVILNVTYTEPTEKSKRIGCLNPRTGATRPYSDPPPGAIYDCVGGSILASIQRPKLFSHMILVGPSPCFLNAPPDYKGGFERADLEGLLELMDQNYIGWAQYFAPVVAGATLNQPLAAKLSNSFCSTDPVMARLFAEVTFFSDIRDQLQHCKTPCLILQHRNDALAPLIVGDYLHQHLTGSTLEILDVSGHCAHMSHPDLVADSMRKYLSGRDSRVLP
ncbi:alpha/beta fold hydrolase [Pseudomonas spirodelae]|uniref:alpha/beta fold hydrolase n=1 Tax=Pseudomonas spirodelae TaxID=3101751 RepID=UPI002AFE1046|nr:alpha/beta hydrolase [Pseudomonas sp. T5W1]